MELRKNIKSMNKRGALMDMFVWLVIIFVVVLFFAAWNFGFGEFSDTMIGLDIAVGDSGDTIGSMADQSLGRVDRAQTKGLELLAVGMIIMFGFSIILTNFIVKANPAFMIVYVFIVSTAVIFSVYISNTFTKLITDSPLSPSLREMGASSFLMEHLPVLVTVIGFVSMIFLFAGIIIDRGAGGSIV